MRFGTGLKVAAVVALLALLGACSTAIAGQPLAGSRPALSTASAQQTPRTFPDLPTGPSVTGRTTTGPSVTEPPTTTSSEPQTTTTGPSLDVSDAKKVKLSLDDKDTAVVLTRGSPKTVIDVYAEPLCPPCSGFEADYGVKLMNATGLGLLGVRIHLMTFLNNKSASGDYSTRAAGTLLCLAKTGDAAETFARLEHRIFGSDFQPKEGGASDHTDAELREAAEEAGASKTSLQCIDSGQGKQLAQKANQAAIDQLTKTGNVGTPKVLRNGAPVDLTDGWIERITS